MAKVFVAAALAFVGFAAKAVDSLTMADFGHKIKLQVNGYTGNETLENFPVLVRVSEAGIPGFHYADMSAKNKNGVALGYDLAFFDEAGNRLASENDTWDASGTSLVWVAVSQLTQGAKFYMCYNVADGVMVENPNPWGDYVGVWHLKETGGSGKTVYDATTNALDGLTYAGKTVASGAVGAGRVIATDNNHAYGIVVEATNGVKKALAESLGTDFHASFWMLAGAAESNLKYGTLLCRRKGDQGYSWMVAFGGDNKTGQSVDYLRVNSDNPNSANIFTENPIGAFLKLNDSVWKKVDVVWQYETNGNDPVVNIYTNGVIAETITSTRNPNPVRQEDANIGIGGSTQDAPPGNTTGHKGRRFNGSMDEVRLHKLVPSADWIKADYDTVNNASFVTVAPPEVLAVTWAEGSGRAGVTNVAWNAVVVGGEITGFGENTTEVTIQGKFWADGGTEPAEWTTLASGLDLNDTFEVSVPCAENTVYNYKLRATDDASGETDPVSGTFTTPLGLAVTWAEDSGRSGVTNILGHSVVVGGSVGCLGSSATVAVEGKFWANGATEPSEWTMLAADIAQAGEFSLSVSGLSVNTLYSYKLRVAGSNGTTTEPVSGTFTTSQSLRVSWAGDAEQPGVTNVAWSAAVVGGIVEVLGDVASCDIEGRFWADGLSEPESWAALGAGGFGLGAFSVPVSNLAENTIYHYKLRATGRDGSETPMVTGTFLTPVGLAVTWAEASGRSGVTNVLCYSVVVGGAIDCLGSSATCTIKGKFWVGEAEPENWTTLGDALSQTGDFSVLVSSLTAGATYNYSLCVEGGTGVSTTPVTGTFTTATGLAISGAVSNVSYGFATLGGTVQSLGEATTCDVQYKVWTTAGSEPENWTTFAENLGLDAAFTTTISGLAAGTAYSYSLRAMGSDGMPSGTISGTFTTQGESGEQIGTSETHFYDDGTNAYWVANEFERYLPFEVTGYTGSETLTNFPVLVDVRKNDTNGFSYDDFYHVGGRDIAFVDEKGHVIPHEIDTWNPNGMTLIWVRLPEMKNGTKFTMCYRSPLVNPPADPGNAFEKYVGVWHMNETGDGIVDVIDSTVNHLDGETHSKSLASSNGRIGGCRRVAQQAGTSSTYGHIIVTDHDDILRTGVGNVFTYSCWSKLADNDPGWAYLVSRKREDTDKGWGIQYHEKENNKLKNIRIWSGRSITADKNDCTLLDISNSNHTPTSWSCWTFVYDNTNCTAYLDGVKLKTVVLKGRNSGTVWPVANDETATYDGLVIGGQEVGTGALNGWVDECRYSKGIRSADWIKAEYDSMLQVNTPFVTKGTQIGRGVESLVPVIVWETGAGLPETVVDVSYAYVQFAGTVTFCGTGADTCRIEYQMWADGEEEPEKNDWTALLDNATAGTKFSIPVFGLKQDMPYNFRIRAVNVVAGETRKTLERTGSFRTNGNVNESAGDGELLRIGNRFVHLYRAGTYTFTTPDYVTNVEIIVVGGGGAGGYKTGGGGGGGGVFYSQSYSVTTNTTYYITVGQGGNAPTNVTTPSSAGNGEYSTFSLDSDREHPLISVPGGGGGGSCSTTANIVTGSDGASGGGAGGRGDGATTGASGGLALLDGQYGNDGGNGNHKNGSSGSAGAFAAGGGGGGRRDGLSASSDKYYGGGAGGSGVACALLGEMLYFGAGGGGGYAFFEDSSGFTKPGAGGSGIGGNAADVKNGTLATSGVENTGAGGGGGSMTKGKNSNTEYWQGGDGGDGVVMIAYEVHGRDPVADDPRISMTRCAYNEDDIIADIDYRVYWAGVQNDVSDILIHYSTVSSNELDSTESGVLLKVAESALGVGSAVFVPPEVGYTYWVRLVARKHASSYSSSEEIASFKVPAIALNGATWKEGSSPTGDYATVSYKLFETNEVTHLYCYWSESREALEGDAPPSGDNVYLLDLGANSGKALSSATSFRLNATEGLVRNRTYYLRLAAGDAQGLKRFLSADIVELDTAEVPATVLNSATWADSNVATVDFRATVGKLAPAAVELVVLYGIVENDVKGKRPETNETVSVVSLGSCSELSLDASSLSATFPLWSEVATNYYVRLALSTNVIVTAGGVVTTNRGIIAGSYSSATKSMDVFHAIEANTLLYIVTANPKVMCYGDNPLPLDYALEYAGQTEGWGWDNKYAIDANTAIACYESTNPAPVAISSTSPSGNYAITRGTLQLVDGGQGQTHRDETTGVESHYQYKLTFSGATYTITNAVFSTAIADASHTYSATAFDTNELVRTLSGVRNSQPVTYLYRVGGAGEWSGELPEFVDVGNYNVQFKATAPNHDDVRSSFKVTVVPAPLAATISVGNLAYTGEAQIPAVTTNVTGLVRGDVNPLTCQFRDETGEWMDEVPAFTQPGTYKLFFRVSAPNHTTFTTNCTFRIVGWEYKVNMDGTTGKENAVDINVSDPGWLLRAKSITGAEFAEDVYGYLNETQANGLKLWQNYIIERSDLSRKLVAAIHQNCQRVAENCFELRFPNIDALRNTGLDVWFRVDRKLKGEAEFTQGELTGKYEVNVPLGPHDPTGLYVFNMVLTPTNAQDNGQAVLSSVATVGVLRVSSALTNTVMSVPWRSMSVDTATNVNVAVSDVVNPNGISMDDMILVYNSGTGDFNGWKHDGYGDWENVATVTKKGVSVSSAEVTRLTRGKAFWLVRSEPSEYIYLLGRYTGEDYLVELDDGTPAAPGNTLVANPTFNDVDLNAIAFVDASGNPATPAVGDRIVVMDQAGMQTIYARNATNTTWGHMVYEKVGRRLQQKWAEGGTIPAGTGFWYNRTGSGTLRIKFEASK